jgi:hypothetical protein
MTSECTTETEARLFLPGAVLHYERRTDVLDRQGRWEAVGGHLIAAARYFFPNSSGSFANFAAIRRV